MGGRLMTTPALMVKDGCATEVADGPDGVTWLMEGVSTLALAAAVDANRICSTGCRSAARHERQT